MGKTTTAVTLAHGLAREERRVLLVDLDAQGNVADALGLEKRSGLYCLMVAGDGVQSRVQSGRPLLDVVLSDHRTVEVKQLLARVSVRREASLRRSLARFEDLYDVCVLDAAPGVDVLQIGALVACTEFLIPVALDHLAVVGAGDALVSVASLQAVGRFEGRFLGVLPTFWERRTREGQGQLEMLARQFGRLVWPPIPTDVRAREAPAYGKTLWEYAPKGRAVRGVVMGECRVGGYGQVLKRLGRERGYG